MLNSPIVHYNKGEGISPIAFMFACPGRREVECGRVVSGVTGKNLDKLLAILSVSENETIRGLFPSPNRYDYLITNASDHAHYPALDGISLPRKSEYLQPSNLARLKTELKTVKYLFAFGEQARAVSKALKEDCGSANSPIEFVVIRVPHLSLLSLNQISHDREGKRIEPGTPNATELRLEVIASLIEKELMNI